MAARWLTFDCFGTLVDWRHGIGTTGELLFPGRGGAFLEAYNLHEAEVEAERPFRRYRDVLAEATRRAARDLSADVSADDATALAATIPHWPHFSDVGPALSRLQGEGWKLALLTNCDRDLIALTQRRLPVPFDAAITAEEAGAYKPDRAHFELFRACFGADAEAWIHCAQSYFHDIRPAQALGVRRIWVNRLQEKDDPALADATIHGLDELPAAVAGLAAG